MEIEISFAPNSSPEARQEVYKLAWRCGFKKAGRISSDFVVRFTARPSYYSERKPEVVQVPERLEAFARRSQACSHFSLIS